MKRLIGLALLAMFMLCCTACQPVVKFKGENLEKMKGQQFEYNKQNFPLKIENLNSKQELEVQVFEKPPRRVVSVWQNSIETLLALGVGDRIVAAQGLPNASYLRPEYREQYEKIPFKTMENMSVENTLMLEPELIVGWQSTFGPKVLKSTDFWHGRGIHTYIAPSSSYGKGRKQNLQNEFNDILNLGKIFDKQERAQQLVDQMQQEIAFVQQGTKNVPKKTRAIILEKMGKEIRTYGSRSLAGNILESLNGELLAPTSTSVSYEQLVELDPDVVFVVVIERDYGNMDAAKKSLMEHKVLRNVRCFKEGRVHSIPLYAVYSAGVRSLDGIQIMARGLYPELYKDKK